MSCFVCTGCGKCELFKKDYSPGTCPVCQHDNEPDADQCEQCGFRIAAPAGISDKDYGEPEVEEPKS